MTSWHGSNPQGFISMVHQASIIDNCNVLTAVIIIYQNGLKRGHDSLKSTIATKQHEMYVE